MRGLIVRAAVAAGAAVALLIPAAAASAGGPPVLSWMPVTSAGTYNYGTVQPGSAVSQTFTLKNSGGSASAALTVTVTGSAFTKTADSCTGTSLGPGKTCTVTVSYRPAAAGQADTATLTATGVKSAATASLALTGAGAKATPVIATSQQPASAAAGSAVADQATVTGGSSPAGTVTFTLYNNPNCTGTPLFTDPNVALTGGTATSAGYTATAPGTDYWTATYNGNTANNAVSSGCADEPVTITGTPDLTISPGTSGGTSGATNYYNYYFGQVASSSQTFTVTNTGNGPTAELIQEFTNGDGMATSNDTCNGTTLAPGGTCTFEVTWTAAASQCTGGNVAFLLFPNQTVIAAPSPGPTYATLSPSASCP